MTEPRRISDNVRQLTAPNPGPMTLDGTNSYLLGSGDGIAVVDPGPADEGHLQALAAAGPVTLILITHQHIDHTEGSPRLAELTGAPVRAAMAEHCHGGGEVLRDGEVIEVGGVRIEVIATPGHSADSVCFRLPDDGGAILTGDTVLGRGTTVIGVPDGTLGQYLDSMRRLISFGAVQGLPAHGPVIDDLGATCQKYLQHRLERLEQVRAAVQELGLAPEADNEDTVMTVLQAVYGEVDPGVTFAAAYSVATQLAYLADEADTGS